MDQAGYDSGVEIYLTNKSAHLQPALHADSDDSVTALRQSQMSVESLEQSLQTWVEPLTGSPEEDPVDLAVESRHTLQLYLSLNCSTGQRLGRAKSMFPCYFSQSYDDRLYIHK